MPVAVGVAWQVETVEEDEVLLAEMVLLDAVDVELELVVIGAVGRLDVLFELAELEIELVVIGAVGPLEVLLIEYEMMFELAPVVVGPAIDEPLVTGAEWVWMVVVPLSVHSVVYVVKLLSLEDEEVVTGAVGPAGVVELPLYDGEPETVLELVVLPPVGPTGTEVLVVL